MTTVSLMPTTPSRSLLMPYEWASRAVTVLVIGAGGSGGETLDALVRLDHCSRVRGGHGLEVAIVDPDTVSPSNVIRQRFVSSDVGMGKVDALVRRYGSFTGLKLRGYRDRIGSRDTLRQLRQFDVVISCVDSAATRVKICDYYGTRLAKTLFLDMGNGASSGQVVLGHLGRVRKDGLAPGQIRLPNVLDLFPELRTVNDNTEPSCSLEAALLAQNLGVNRFMADIAVFTLLAPLMFDGQIATHGAYIDMVRPSMSGMRIDPAAWARKGYAKGLADAKKADADLARTKAAAGGKQAARRARG